MGDACRKGSLMNMNDAGPIAKFDVDETFDENKSATAVTNR
jgi:hypothetical protein